MEDIVYLNGDFLPLKEAKISAIDYGFLYGFGLFETMRAYNGSIFRLEAHLNRLAKSAEKLGIEIDVPSLQAAVTETIRKNSLKEARVRLSVSAGEGSLIPDPHSCAHPTVLVIARKYVAYSSDIYEKGFQAIFSTARRNIQSPLSSMKTANYLDCLLARQEAKDAGVDESLLLNEAGLLSEGSMSNLFLVDRGRLITPPVNAGILPGITRGVVLELAPSLGIKVVEKDVLPEKLTNSEEAFLTNSLIEIMPLTMIMGRSVGTGMPGTLTRRLAEAYREQVRRETKGMNHDL
jgi:branched-chain amino acid aminotransferase